MNPTPEQAAQWAREAGIPEIVQATNPPAFLRLVTRAMAEKAEADAKLCDSLEYEFRSGANCATAIRASAPKVTT